MLKKIILARPRGFCAGVTRAIGIVNSALERYGAPVYMKHEIVHNEHVVEELGKKGAVFVEELEQIPKNSVVILSAHGSTPEVIEDAQSRGYRILIDSVCPLVRKVHNEAVRFHKEGYCVIIIGKKGHQEVVGTMGYAPMHLISDVEDAENLEIANPEKVAYISQTTFSQDDIKDIVDVLKEKYPNLTTSAKGDICYATQNRQDALKELSKVSDVILIIGSKSSSNTKSLERIALKHCSSAYLIQDASELRKEYLEGKKILGITAGASTPEHVVQSVIERIKEFYPQAETEEKTYVDENVSFPLPTI